MEGRKQRLVVGRAKSQVAREMDKMNQNRDLRGRFYCICKHQHPYLPCLHSNIINNDKLLRVTDAQEKVDKYSLYKAKMVEKRQKWHTC